MFCCEKGNPEGGNVVVVLKYHNRNIFKSVFLRKKGATVYFALSYVVVFS